MRCCNEGVQSRLAELRGEIGLELGYMSYFNKQQVQD